MSAPEPGILIVEDEALIAFVLQMELEKHGYRVCAHVDNGDQAVAATRTSRPDVVLMDIRIKGPMDGIETASAIRRVCDQIQIVFITGYGNKEMRTRAAAVKPIAFLEKPVHIDTLLKYL